MRNYDHIATLLRDARENLGLSQTELAGQLGYPHKHFISNLENGRRMIPYDRVRDFSKALKIKISDIEQAYLEDCRMIFYKKIQ